MWFLNLSFYIGAHTLFGGGAHKSRKSNILLIVIQFLIRNHAIYMDVGFKIYEEEEMFCFFTLPDASILQV
jgi:hypothetical protein